VHVSYVDQSTEPTEEFVDRAYLSIFEPEESEEDLTDGEEETDGDETVRRRAIFGTYGSSSDEEDHDEPAPASENETADPPAAGPGVNDAGDDAEQHTNDAEQVVAVADDSIAPHADQVPENAATHTHTYQDRPCTIEAITEADARRIMRPNYVEGHTYVRITFVEGGGQHPEPVDQTAGDLVVV